MSFTPHVPAPTNDVRPKWLGLAAVGAIVISVFQIVNGLATPLGLAFIAHNPFASLSGMPHMAKMFSWQEKLFAFPAPQVSLLVGFAGLGVGIWALTRAIGVLSRKPGGRTPFRRSVVALAAVESVNSVIGIWFQSRSVELSGELVEAMAPSGGSSPGFETTMGTFLQAGMLIGLVFTVAWGAAKIAFLAWAHRYTGMPNVADHLDRSVSQSSPR